MRTKSLCVLVVQFLIVACSDNELEQLQTYFSLSETSLNFKSDAATQSIRIENPAGQTKVELVSEDSDWCTVSIVDDALQVSVSENVLVDHRNATIEVISGDEKIQVLVRQSPKWFTTVAPVTDLTAISGPGQVTLKWTEPTEDNFSHVLIRYTQGDEEQVITVGNGVVEYIVTGLMSTDGDYTFAVQSVDKENDLGEIVTVVERAQKLVAFGFEKHMVAEWLPFYLRSTDAHTTFLRIGSDEFNEDQNVAIDFAVNEAALTEYNTANSSQFDLMPSGAYALPENYTFTGTTPFQEVAIELDIGLLEDGKAYALPLAIESAQGAAVDDAAHTVMLLYRVDDLAGWYTVDRLEKSGEGAGQYPSNPNDRRRYVKRTGATTWETGYVFRSYSVDENQVGGGTSTQYISLDPATKTIFIQQGNYAVAESANTFDTETNELHIEYLYRDWAGWWTHERMYNRSFNK